MAGLLMVVSGAASLFSLVRPNAPGESPGGVLTVGLVAALFGGIVWLLPWRRWPSRLTLLLIPVGFLFIALRNYEGGNDPFLIPIFFVAASTWIGLTQPRGLLWSPPRCS